MKTFRKRLTLDAVKPHLPTEVNIAEILEFRHGAVARFKEVN